jgi:FMN-dependent NADH-azoreductase
MFQSDEETKIRRPPDPVYQKLYSRAMEKAKKVMRKPNADFLRKGRGAALKQQFIKELKEEEEIVIAIPLKAGRVPVSEIN